LLFCACGAGWLPAAAWKPASGVNNGRTSAKGDTAAIGLKRRNADSSPQCPRPRRARKKETITK